MAAPRLFLNISQISRRAILLPNALGPSPCLQCYLGSNTTRVPILGVIKRNHATKQTEDTVKAPLRTQRYAFNKLVDFITSSSDKLEKRIPKVYKVYRTFRKGLSSFMTDTKEYYMVSSRLWGGESLTSFTRRELELYRQFSSEIPLMGFMMVVAFAPGGAFVFPIAYMFPRLLLTRHFWTPDQVVDFRRIELTKQMRHYDSILDFLYILSQHIENDAAKSRVRKAINKLDTSVNLSTSEIEALKPLFEGRPYKIDSISIRHLRHLSKSLGLSVRRKKLVKKALLLHYIDLAILKEGIETLSNEELDTACAWRGYNPEGVSPQQKMSYLTNWLHVSANIKGLCNPLLSQLPVENTV